MKTIAKPFQTSIDIKKSQFICRLFPAQTEKLISADGQQPWLEVPNRVLRKRQRLEKRVGYDVLGNGSISAQRDCIQQRLVIILRKQLIYYI